MSIVIVRNSYGFTAHLRFANPSLDRYISADTHWVVYEKIEKYVHYLGVTNAGL